MKTCIALLLALSCLNLSAQNTDLLPETNIDRTMLLVKHRVSVKDTVALEFHEQQGAKTKKLKHLRWSAVKLKDNEKHLIENYRKSRLFERVDFARRCFPDVTPNDPLYPQLWGMARIQAAAGWDKTRSSDVVVAVIDTGVDYNHPDLRDNLWIGPQGEHGYTASGGIIAAGGQDDHYHGTHVAGIIGAVGNNGIGVAGINWRIQLASFKFIGAGGFGYDLDAALCIEQMVALKEAGYNIRVSNNSWGAPGESAILEDAFRLAQEAGILNVCAAGNDGKNTDDEPFFPAAIPLEGIVSVQASDRSDRKAHFSNYGETTTHLLAPGIGILSTKLNGDYWELSGTSMASPHVAAVCAALFGLNPAMTPKQCKTVLLNSGSLDQTEFRQNRTAGGRLNLAKAVNNPLLSAPPENHDPVLRMDIGTNLVSLAPGETRRVTASATDDDTNALSYTASAKVAHMGGPSGWLIRRVIGDPSTPGLPTNNVAITNLPKACDLAISARFGVTDGNGGAGVKRTTFFTWRDESLVRTLPTATLSLRTDPNEIYPLLKLTVPGLGPDDGKWSYYIWRQGEGFGQSCCFPINTETPVYSPFVTGANLFRAQVMDNDGNFSNSERLLINTGNTEQTGPELRITINKLRGPSPLEVVADMGPTQDGYPYPLDFTAIHWREGGYSFDTDNPVRRFTLTEPGIHPIQFYAYDAFRQMGDVRVEIFTVLPAGSTDSDPPPPNPPPNPPPARLIAPLDLRVLESSGFLVLSWSDTATGEDRWELEVNKKAQGHWTGFRSLAVLNADSRSYSLAAARANFQFRAKACKESACSRYSNVASIRVR